MAIHRIGSDGKRRDWLQYITGEFDSHRLKRVLVKVYWGVGLGMATPIELPAPKFRHFERVRIMGDEPRYKQWQGERGTVIWLDSSAVRRQPTQPDQWLYVVHLPAHSAWRTFFQSDLESEGGFDPESAHLGTRPEISLDLVMEENNGWMEGSYRLPGEFWKVVIFQKDDVPELRSQPSSWQRPTRWEREINGVVIRFPRTARMGRDDLLRAMVQVFGWSDWVQVDGPDSMMLR